MARKRGIPPELEPQVLAKAGEGHSSRGIASWLLEEHGIAVGHVAVARFLAAKRDERAVIAKAVTREALKKTVLSDLDVLARERTRLMKVGSLLYRNLTVIAEGLDPKDLAEGAELDRFKAARARLNAVAELADSVGRTSERLQKLIGQRMQLAGASSPDDAGEKEAPTVETARALMRQLFGAVTPTTPTDAAVPGVEEDPADAEGSPSAP